MEAAQREWNKVARGVDARNYYKSPRPPRCQLQRLPTRRPSPPRHSIAEIDSAKAPAAAAPTHLGSHAAATQASSPLVYVMDDMHVLTDVLKLAFSYLDRATGSYSSNDRDRIETFLRTFVPKLLAVDVVDFEELLNVMSTWTMTKPRASPTMMLEAKAPPPMMRMLIYRVWLSTWQEAGRAICARRSSGTKPRTSKQTETVLKNRSMHGAAASANARASSPTIVADVDSVAEALANQTSATGRRCRRFS